MKHKNKFSSQVRMATILIAFVTIIWISAQTLLSCSSPVSQTQTTDSVDSNAIDIAKLLHVKTNPALQENIVEYSGMTVSFNPRLHIPNWVAWELTADETDGEEPRYDKFTCDENVPGCPDDWDYKYTGYDRGHMAPAADMKWNEQAMKESFFLTNICPQAPDLNRGSWKKLEEKCRLLAKKDSSVIIICGPILTDEIKEYLGDNKVAVPQRFFKVILSPFEDKNSAIAFIMPNAKVIGGMQPCAVTIDSVETVTGHDFFSNLPDDIEDLIESQCNFNAWSRRASKAKTCPPQKK
ncbi:MAG: DNA/RNA non-specific endonuclease [Muribaculaceae bacterium]